MQHRFGGFVRIVRIVRVKNIYKAVPYKPYKAYRGKVCCNTTITTGVMDCPSLIYIMGG